MVTLFLQKIIWLYQKFISPAIQIFKSLGLRHVKHKHTAVSASVKSDA